MSVHRCGLKMGCGSSKSILGRCPRKASGKKKNLKEEASHFRSSKRQEVMYPDPTTNTVLGVENRAG